MVAWLGPAISAGASVLGGFLSRDAQRDANAANAAAAAQNIRMQEEFAKKGIRWKVADARAAGIHPLYALGAQTTSFSPVSVGAQAETGLASGLASAGQDIGRAINATRTSGERVDAYTQALQGLTLERGQLQNEVLRTQLASVVARLRQQINPPLPAGAFEVPEKTKADERTPLMLEGNRVATSPGTSPGKAWEDQLGDDLFSPGFIPNLIGMIRENTRGMTFMDILRAIDRKTAIDWSSWKRGGR